MDPQGCFSPPLSSNLLANQTNGSSVISGFPRNNGIHDMVVYPRLIPAYDMHPQQPATVVAASFNQESSNKEREASTSPHHPSVVYQSGTPNKKNSSSSVVDGPEPTDMTMAPPPGAPTPANTRLLREILQQGKKHGQDLDMEELDDDAMSHSPASMFDEEDDEDHHRGRRSMTKSDLEDGSTDEMGGNRGGGVIRRTGSPMERLTVGGGGLRVDSLLGSGMRMPSNGASSENSESAASTSSCGGGDGSRRKTKRKQIYPQQVDEAARHGGAALVAEVGGAAGQEKDVMRKQLSLMQEQIDVMQERYDSIFDENESHQKVSTGSKRKHTDDRDDPIDTAIAVGLAAAEAGVRAPFLKGVRRMNDRLAALISTEIHEKISPIVASVINKYLQGSAPVDTGKPPIQLSAVDPPPLNHRSKAAASPAERPPSPLPMSKKQPTEQRTKQPLIVSNGGGGGDDSRMSPKNFPPLYRNFPAHPFFGNENKLGHEFNIQMSQLAAMAGAAPTMFNPNFHPLVRPAFFPAEQTEAMPLVVSPKKKRHKVTDTRITPRGSMMGKMMNGMKEDSQDGSRKFSQTPPVSMNTMNSILGFNGNGHNPFVARSLEMHGLNHSDRSPFHPQGGMDVSRFGPTFFFNNHGSVEQREASSPLGGSAGTPEDNDELSMDASDMDSTDMSVGGGRPATNFSRADSLTYPLSSTLTPMHLRKAKLMFFFTRYPNSATLKTFFPDIKFNKNNTAQLVKWFSNFREYYYIQMERTAKQLLADGTQNADEIEVAKDSELYRALNLHYNRNNHIDVPDAFRDVVEETLKEFFKALQCKRDQEPSWKKAIYKIINRMDDSIPDYFRLPHFLEQLE
ncbi:Homeobox protein prospero [Hypsibius exemplaris]|uniref:Homeobox protein prospero n=1 Tax=Hypsibius exemplaris TaxID=2072580 RepID=A0A1W0W9V1_HYPEX|nr:Homeobox protein prospero [Hypsibius exemplaris]